MWCRCCNEVQMHVRSEEMLETVFLWRRKRFYFYIWLAWLFSAWTESKEMHDYYSTWRATRRKKRSFLYRSVECFQNYFMLSIFFYLFLTPPLFPLPLTILGWRLRSLEWALSNFYPWSFTASHDPWANGIAPSLFSLCTFAVLYFQYFWLIYIL